MSEADGQKFYYHKEVYDRDEALQQDEKNKLHLPIASVPYSHEFYQELLGITLEDLRQMSALQCAENSLLLTNYSMFIQRIANNEKSRIVFLKNKVDSIICKKIRQYSGSWDLQRAAAIADDGAATKFNNDLIYAEQRLARLADLHFSITKTAEKFTNIQYMKQHENK